MRKDITNDELTCLMQMLHMMTNIGLTKHDFVQIWEKRPQVIINRLGDFELENPEEIYGVIIEYYDIDALNNFKTPPRTRFRVSDLR